VRSSDEVVEVGMILVVGATGQFGRQAVEGLAAAGVGVRALTRKPGDAGLPEGVEVVGGDLERPETLGGVVRGVDAVLLVLPYGLDPGGLLEAARKEGVGRVVFLSAGTIDDDAAEQRDVISAYHANVERAIKEAGFGWTFLRILFPAINTLTFNMQLSAGDVIRAPYGQASSSYVHERDVAEVAVRVLTEDGHAGEVYELTGPESLTQADAVRILGAGLGRELSYVELEPGPVIAQLAQFMDGEFVRALFGHMAASVGRAATVTKTVSEITGHPARGYREWVGDHVADYR
jgi:uncharacterized protein YbjT (DUF2867 family)